jgi:methylsterol monooxygenase
MGINVLGLLWTVATIQFGIPKSLRIQDRSNDWATLRDRLPLVFLNQAILMAVVYVAMGAFSDVFTADTPTVPVLLGQVAIIVLLDDAWFYAWHRLMHEHKGLYNRVHRIHHKAYAPLPIEYIYVHPLEWMVGAIGPFLGLLVLNLAWGAIPAWSLWAYLLVRNLHELDVHSGIKSPLGKWIPLYAPAEHHDLHHAKPTKGNFASTLRLWDIVLGTHWRPES